MAPIATPTTTRIQSAPQPRSVPTTTAALGVRYPPASGLREAAAPPVPPPRRAVGSGLRRGRLGAPAPIEEAAPASTTMIRRAPALAGRGVQLGVVDMNTMMRK